VCVCVCVCVCVRARARARVCVCACVYHCKQPVPSAHIDCSLHTAVSKEAPVDLFEECKGLLQLLFWRSRAWRVQKGPPDPLLLKHVSRTNTQKSVGACALSRRARALASTARALWRACPWPARRTSRVLRCRAMHVRGTPCSSTVGPLEAAAGRAAAPGAGGFAASVLPPAAGCWPSPVPFCPCASTSRLVVRRPSGARASVRRCRLRRDAIKGTFGTCPRASARRSTSSAVATPRAASPARAAPARTRSQHKHHRP